MNKKARMLAKENEREEEKIWDASEEVYTDIIVYLRVSRLSEYSQELVRSDIIQMILDGQARGEGIGTVIGEDYKGFCDEIIETFPPKRLKDKVLETLDTTCMCLSILGLISLIFNFIDNIRLKNHLFTYSLSAADVVNFIVIVTIANLVVYVICKGAFEQPKKESKVRLVLEGAFIFALLTGIFLCAKLFLDNYAVQFNMVIAAVVIAVAYVIHRVIGTRDLA